MTMGLPRTKTEVGEKTSVTKNLQYSPEILTANGRRVEIQESRTSKLLYLQLVFWVACCSYTEEEELLEIQDSPEVHANAAEALCAITRYDPPGIVTKICSPRFADETVFDSSYKCGRPLTMHIGVSKVIRGLDQCIFGGDELPPMQVGGKRKLLIPPLLAYGPEHAGCFSGCFELSSSNLQQPPYTINSPLILPPYDSLPPSNSIPSTNDNNSPPYCVYPPSPSNPQLSLSPTILGPIPSSSLPETVLSPPVSTSSCE